MKLKVEANEYETVILQRRAIRASSDLLSGATLEKENIFPLRPCPSDGIPPFRISEIVGKKLKKNIKEGDIIRFEDLI